MRSCKQIRKSASTQGDMILGRPERRDDNRSKKILVSNKFSRVMLIRKGLRGGYTSTCKHLYMNPLITCNASNLVWTTQAQFTTCSKQFCIYS